MNDDTTEAPANLIEQIDAANDEARVALDALRELVEDEPKLELISDRLESSWDTIEKLCIEGKGASTAIAPLAPAQPNTTTEEASKLPSDRVDDARTLIWEAQALCNVGRAAYGDENLDVYNLLGSIERTLDGAGKELAELDVGRAP